MRDHEASSRRASRHSAIVAALPAMSQRRKRRPGEGPYLIKGGTVVNHGDRRAIAPTRTFSFATAASRAWRRTSRRNDAKVIDATGKFVYPGMIDANTRHRLAGNRRRADDEHAQRDGAVQSAHAALVALNVESEILGVTRMNGVTSVLTSPTGGAISGQATLINTAGWTWEDLAVVRNAGIDDQPPRRRRRRRSWRWWWTRRSWRRRRRHRVAALRPSSTRS